MKKVFLLTILAMVMVLCAQAQDQNAYFANYHQHHTLEQMQDFSDLHDGMTKERCIKDLTTAINKMLCKIGQPTGGNGVNYIDEMGEAHYLPYFDCEMTAEVIANATKLTDAPVGTVSTVGWRSSKSTEWFTRDQKIVEGIPERFMYFNVGKYYNIESLNHTIFLYWSDICGNPTVLIKKPLAPKPKPQPLYEPISVKEGSDWHAAPPRQKVSSSGVVVNNYNTVYGDQQTRNKDSRSWFGRHRVGVVIVSALVATATTLAIVGATGGFDHHSGGSSNNNNGGNNNSNNSGTGTTTGTGGPGNVVTIE